MLRVALIIAAILLGTSAGCRSVPPTPLAKDHRGTMNPRTPVATAQRSDAGVRSIAFVHTAEEIDEARALPEPPESSSGEWADAPGETALTLADLEGIALHCNPALAAAAARVEAARGRQVQVALYPNPVVGYHATEIGNLGTAGQQGGFVSQRFVMGGKLGLDQAIAGTEIDEAHFQFHAQQQRVVSDVRIRFYDSLVAQRRLELTRQLSRVGDDLVQATDTLLEQRLGTENDLLQAQIKADEAHILYDNAGNQNVEAWRRLAAVIGVPTIQMTPLAGKLDGDLSSLDWDDCYGLVLGNNPQLQAARTRVERASIVMRRARKEPIPNVDLQVSVRHHSITDSDVANVQVGIPLPILNRNQGHIRAARAEWVAACNEVRRMELDLHDRLAIAYRRYTSARQQVGRYSQRMIPRAERSLKLVSDGYEKGQVEYLLALTAQQTHLNVNLAYLDSLRDLRAAAASIQGQLLSGSLTNLPATP